MEINLNPNLTRHSIRSAASFFGVHERTVRRWMSLKDGDSQSDLALTPSGHCEESGWAYFHEDDLERYQKDVVPYLKKPGRPRK